MPPHCVWLILHWMRGLHSKDSSSLKWNKVELIPFTPFTSQFMHSGTDWSSCIKRAKRKCNQEAFETDCDLIAQTTLGRWCWKGINASISPCDKRSVYFWEEEEVCASSHLQGLAFVNASQVTLKLVIFLLVILKQQKHLQSYRKFSSMLAFCRANRFRCSSITLWTGVRTAQICI